MKSMEELCFYMHIFGYCVCVRICYFNMFVPKHIWICLLLVYKLYNELVYIFIFGLLEYFIFL